METRFQHGGKVLQAVDGDVDGAVVERLLEFLDKYAFVEDTFGFRDFGEGHIRAAVAGGADDDALDGEIRERLFQQCLRGVRLHQGQRAAARADAEMGGRRGGGHVDWFST